MSNYRPAIPAAFTRAFPCPRCAGWMKTVHNPSFGVGLARHHYIRLCGNCDFAAFIPETLVQHYNDLRRRQPKEQRAKAAPTRKSWFGRRKP